MSASVTGKQPDCELLTGSLAASPNLMDVIFSKWAADLNLPSNRGRGAERGGARETEREFILKTLNPREVRDVECICFSLIIYNEYNDV